jgi:hypothetical protein
MTVFRRKTPPRVEARTRTAVSTFSLVEKASWRKLEVAALKPQHLADGTRVEAVRSRNGVMRYASKLYVRTQIRLGLK